jgi:MSHA biogenesis protein MshJ
MIRWHSLLARVNRASLRERGLLFAACLLVLVALWDQALMRPIDARRLRLVAALAESQDRLNKPPGEGGSGRATDVYTDLRTRELSLAKAIESADEALKDAQRGIIDPKQMVKVLTDVLAGQGRLQFVLLHNLPVEALIPQSKDEGAPSGDPGGPYLHPIELVLRGNYLDVLAYLRELEAAQQGFQWRRFEYTSGESGPEYRIQFTTLSMDSNWLGV